ncbi:MAG: glycosyltransferase [Alphaproteobacteria bacterium]|nr:glycosyltransferase [Alphaproteobacteria bacterium]
MAKIKVVFCIPNMVIGGVENVLVNTVNELMRDDNLDIAIALHAPVREPVHRQWLAAHPQIPVYTYYPLCNWFEDMQKYCRVFPLKPLRKIAFSLYKKYRRMVARCTRPFADADIFIDYKNLSFFKELRNAHAPRITWVHGPAGYLCDNGLAPHVNIYDHIVGLTDDFVAEFSHVIPGYRGRVTRIYNPIDGDKIRRMAACGTTHPGHYFCQVSRLDPVQKDLKTLLGAFDLFWGENGAPDVQLVIVGDGAQADELQQMATQLPSGRNIIFTGATSNPFGFMAGAMATILATRYEGLPTVLIESAVLGVPCISSDCPNGPREILMNGHAGLLFNVGDVRQLADHMTAIWTSTANTLELAATATENLVRFNPATTASQITHLIKEYVK